MIRIEDLAYIWQTCYEPSLNFKKTKNGKKVSRLLFAYFLGRRGVINQMGL